MSARQVAALGGKWKPLVVYELRQGRWRFSELQRAIPEATRQMLTQQLRQLEADGVVRRTVHSVVPPRVDYELTPMGRELEPVLAALEKWGERLLATGGRGGVASGALFVRRQVSIRVTLSPTSMSSRQPIRFSSDSVEILQSRLLGARGDYSTNHRDDGRSPHERVTPPGVGDARDQRHGFRT